MRPVVNIFWFRRDLRLEDNAGLFYALGDHLPVLPLFIYDTHWLEEQEDKSGRRVEFVHLALQEMQKQLLNIGSSLLVRSGKPTDIFSDLLRQYRVDKVFSNHEYEPYAAERDLAVSDLLREQGTGFHTFKDQVIMERNEVVKEDGKPYTVFTPYSRKWKLALKNIHLKPYPNKKRFNNFFRQPAQKLITPRQMGFKPEGKSFPSKEWPGSLLKKYKEQRNFPAVTGTSRLSVHLRYGTISIRALAADALALSETFLDELIWREFFQMILWHFPRVVGQAFKPEYDNMIWRNNPEEFESWCKGQTGYPIVDAGMRELNETGFMHNRVRMIVASFLVKHLLIDWRWGEAWFAKKLLDFDLAANNGGWQWAAGSGCDAAPYFRVFNPYLQTKKFDPDFTYIRKWVPEFQELTYPPPLVQHEFARKRCIKIYQDALKK